MCHKGFSGDSSVVVRSNFSVCGQETTPQSLTAHTFDRSGVSSPSSFVSWDTDISPQSGTFHTHDLQGITQS